MSVLECFSLLVICCVSTFQMNDPYEQEQQRLLTLFDEEATDEEIDPFADSDGEFGSDKNYEQSSSESDESFSSSSSDVPAVSRKTVFTRLNKKSTLAEETNLQTTPVTPEPLPSDGVVSPEPSPLISPRHSTPAVPFDTDSWESTMHCSNS